MCYKLSTTDEIVHSMKQFDVLWKDPTFTIGERFELESLSTTCRVVHIVRNNHGVKLFDIALKWP